MRSPSAAPRGSLTARRAIRRLWHALNDRAAVTFSNASAAFRRSSQRVWPDAAALYRYRASTAGGSEWVPHVDTGTRGRCVTTVICLSTGGIDFDRPTGSPQAGDLRLHNCYGNTTCRLTDGKVPPPPPPPPPSSQKVCIDEDEEAGDERNCLDPATSAVDDRGHQQWLLPVVTSTACQAGRAITFLAENIHSVGPLLADQNSEAETEDQQQRRDVLVVWSSCTEDLAVLPERLLDEERQARSKRRRRHKKKKKKKKKKTKKL